MSICKLAQDALIHGVTPVSNLFIAEYLPGAPADYVKVYLYALMDGYYHQSGDLDGFGKDLGLSKEAVENAFSYWERRGLIRQLGGVYEFLPVLSAVGFHSSALEGSLSQYQDFNNALTVIMGNRLLVPEDFQMAYDWMEVLGMSEDCVLTMVSYAIHQKYKKGNKVSFSTLNKLAVSWADKGIVTHKQAEEYVEHQLLIHSGADTLLRHLGIYGRDPTVDEYQLYVKWTEEYGFTLNAILKACKEMVYSKNPSFALLDVILDKYKEQNVLDEKGIESTREKETKRHRLYQEVMKRCGGYGSATQAQKKVIDRLLELGFNRQGLLYLCDHCAAVGRVNLSAVEQLAGQLAQEGIVEENQVCEHLEKIEAGQKAVKEFLEAAGFTRQPGAADRELYRHYLSAFDGNREILLKAAALAAKAGNKTQALHETLERWVKEGVKSPEAAKPVPPAGKVNPALQYAQRDTQYKLEDIFDNL